MKKTLAIVLALAMVLCMIPASFAATSTNKTISDKSYNLTVWSWEGSNVASTLGSASNANSVTAEYNYETEKADITGKFTEDKKMAIAQISGFDADFKKASNIEVTIDGKKLEVNGNAAYNASIGFFADSLAVNFPVELTKAGYSDTYLVEVTGENGDVKITETAKVTLKMVNTAEYKNAKTATISKIESKNSELDAYIVGSKIYLDFVNNALDLGEELEITFKDENGNLFSNVTWAYDTTTKGGKGGIISKPAEGKLEDSKTKYNVSAATWKNTDYAKELVFNLETSSAKYETKEYDVVVRTDIKEADPKGIYFAESTKTIKIGEDYTPVVMGVATGKKVNATLEYGPNTSEEVIYIDGDTVTGTKEGVAYITATYKTTAAGTETYKASSMKIVVTAGEVEEPTDGAAKYVVTASSLNVRSGAGTGYSKIGSLKNGAIVEVETIANGWAKLANGGYVSAQYLSKVVENGEAVTMYVTCRTLNVRKGPGTSYAKAGTLSRGTAVQVVGMTGSWAKLSNGTYVSANYLSK